ncbi:MAG TPA: AccI family restriction endonuclease [Gallicola sp.]|nr:AccI family restriction endonuclease [Gallicola sp.]
MMASSNYKSKVEQAINNSRKDLIDLTIERKKSNPPTQASSEFLTNKKQGDWAEKTFINAFNSCTERYVAVKYGLDNELVAGDEGFDDFYKKYQDDLDLIGKKPDILILPKRYYEESWNYNISYFEEEALEHIVSHSICGIEVRSSSFLHEVYESYSEEKTLLSISRLLSIKDEIINNYSDTLIERNPELFAMINNLDLDDLSISFRTPSWKKTASERRLCKLLKKLNFEIRELKKRDFLSITPKVEDLRVVYNWVKKYNKPHYYIQVFFDVAFGIGYLDILEMISEDQIENARYFIERDTKNQNKTTIKISTRECKKVMQNINIPNHFSVSKEIGSRGRLLFHVDFDASEGDIIRNNLSQLLGISDL